MKKLVNILSIALSFFLIGCTILRYDLEIALNNLPIGYKVIRLGNYHIDYSLDGISYRAYYGEGGNIYKTRYLPEVKKREYEPRYF